MAPPLTPLVINSAVSDVEVFIAADVFSGAENFPPGLSGAYACGRHHAGYDFPCNLLMPAQDGAQVIIVSSQYPPDSGAGKIKVTCTDGTTPAVEDNSTYWRVFCPAFDVIGVPLTITIASG